MFDFRAASGKPVNPNKKCYQSVLLQRIPFFFLYS